MRLAVSYASFVMAILCLGGFVWLHLSGFVQAFVVPGGEIIDWLVAILLPIGGLIFLIIGIAVLRGGDSDR
jgi:hypothetical protein